MRLALVLDSANMFPLSRIATPCSTHPILSLSSFSPLHPQVARRINQLCSSQQHQQHQHQQQNGQQVNSSAGCRGAVVAPMDGFHYYKAELDAMPDPQVQKHRGGVHVLAGCLPRCLLRKGRKGGMFICNMLFVLRVAHPSPFRLNRTTAYCPAVCSALLLSTSPLPPTPTPLSPTTFRQHMPGGVRPGRSTQLPLLTPSEPSGNRARQCFPPLIMEWETQWKGTL